MSFLFRFGYESPSEFANNAVQGWDDESSAAIWIECESETEALAWGTRVADAFVTWLFKSKACTGYIWSEAQFASWIEQDENELAATHNYGRSQMVRVGEFPDFSAMTN